MREAFTDAEKSAYWLDPPQGRIQPKDFAFLFAQDKFHVFYIRQNQWNPIYSQFRLADSTEKDLGHARSWNLAGDWKWAVPPDTSPIDTAAFSVRPGQWDSFHVWAPSIVQSGSTFYMFYTGVNDVTLPNQTHRHDQRIGVATSTDLTSWNRFNPVLSVADIPWAKKAPPTALDNGAQQLRDPFVMPDPAQPGHWLMYFTASDSAKSPAMAIGVARSTGDLLQWTPDAHPLRCTDSSATNGAFRVESPHVFAHSNRWWLFFSPSSPHGIGDGDVYSPVSFVVSDSLGDPTDTLAAHWSRVDTLYHYQHDDPLLQYWHGSEYLSIGGHEYLAAYDDYRMGIVIGEINWYGPRDFVVGSASAADLDVKEPVVGPGARLLLSGAQPAQSTLHLRVELPVGAHARLLIHDVLGRQVALVLDRDLPAGRTEFAWDGRDAGGAPVPGGIYFARLICPAGESVAKAVLLR